MSLCSSCLRCTHNEPLVNNMCKKCYEWDKEYNEEYEEKEVDVNGR